MFKRLLRAASPQRFILNPARKKLTQSRKVAKTEVFRRIRRICNSEWRRRRGRASLSRETSPPRHPQSQRMKTEDQYLRFVRWSDDDQLYVGYCPDLFPWGGVC